MHHHTDRIAHTAAFVTPVVEYWLEREQEKVKRNLLVDIRSLLTSLISLTLADLRVTPAPPLHVAIYM